jgi:7-keto-8-aminopelargonate synthetase-like enzyme
VPTAEERLAILDEVMTTGASKGLLHIDIDDHALDGRTVLLDGRRHINFGSCSYLGLELDPRMKAAAIDAVNRYGTQFSSSRSYLQSPQYNELEPLLDEMFGGHVLVTPTTSLGHLATLPVLVESRDAVLLDHQVHASVQMAANQLRVKGATVELIRHNNIERLEAMIKRLAPTHQHIWYMADGVYSMFADLAPFAELVELLDRYPQLHMYIDDSHGVGWAGKHGRGPALDAMGMHPRLVAACSLNKSFACAGGAIVFPNAEWKRKVRTTGGPMIFSGPVQPPLLGAAIQSAKIHLSDELPEMQAALRERIELFTDLANEFYIPLASLDVTPIRYIPLGLPTLTHDVLQRLVDDGHYTNFGTFPAVPMKHTGVRVTLTLHHTLDDVRALVESLAEHVPAALAEADEAARRRHVKIVGESAPALTLEHHRSADALDEDEWDHLLGERGTFTVDGLRYLERAFAVGRGVRPEDEWDFHYYLVRDAAGVPVLATFFTAALWKDDMMSSAEVSELVEQRRKEDPYYLTSRTFAMGSLLTEGDHLYLDRNKDWKSALDLLMAAVAEHAQAEGAGTIVFRDLHSADVELAEAVKERGYVRTSLPDSLVYEPVAGGDAEWLASLSSKARVHQRKSVLPFDDAYDVEWLRAGGRDVSEAELEHLYALYLAVQQRGRDLNSFPLPKSFLRDMLSHPSWELMTLTLKETGQVVAFGAHFVGARHYAPMVVGLDYAVVRTHGAYRQAMRRAILRARELGSRRVLLGMGATFEKARFGAHVQERVAFAQASDHYSSEVLAALAADTHGA